MEEEEIVEEEEMKMIYGGLMQRNGSRMVNRVVGQEISRNLTSPLSHFCDLDKTQSVWFTHQ